MGEKLDKAWADVKATAAAGVADVGNVYQAVLTQDASWNVPLPPQSSAPEQTQTQAQATAEPEAAVAEPTPEPANDNEPDIDIEQ
jgi:hypothetical protein